MPQQFEVKFIASSKLVVIKILKKHYNSDRIKQIETKELVNNSDGNGYDLKIPVLEVEELQDFLDCMDSRGKVDIVETTDCNCEDGYYYKVRLD
jgi:hypothetical protein